MLFLGVFEPKMLQFFVFFCVMFLILKLRLVKVDKGILEDK